MYWCDFARGENGRKKFVRRDTATAATTVAAGKRDRYSCRTVLQV